MPDFSVILKSPIVRAIVQDGLLERAFHDSLVPRLLFRSEAVPQEWPGGLGDSMTFSAPGLMNVSAAPLQPGQDPDVSTYAIEQWTAQIQQYAGSVDTHMPTSLVAIANLFLRNAHQLGIQAGQSLNRVVRNKMFGAALSGWGVVDTAASSTTSVHVVRLQGFTRARTPGSATGSQVQFATVSANNPLNVTIFDNGAATANTVVGFLPDNPGDESGPGTLTLGTSVTSVAARAYIQASDRSYTVFSGGGNSVNNVGSNSLPTLADIRSAIAHFWGQNVPTHPDDRFHSHIDPVSQAKLYSDPEFQRLMTALPDYYVYKQFVLGEMLNTVFLRNSENPLPETVVGGTTASYSLSDPFPGEVYSNGNASTGIRLHRILFTAYGGIFEYYSNMEGLLTEAGVTGKVGEPQIVNNGIEVFTERVALILRAPLNRLQDTVSASWKILADWPVRTDASTGDASRYKRFSVITHGE